MHAVLLLFLGLVKDGFFGGFGVLYLLFELFVFFLIFILSHADLQYLFFKACKLDFQMLVLFCEMDEFLDNVIVVSFVFCAFLYGDFIYCPEIFY